MNDYKSMPSSQPNFWPPLPETARLPINRCNLPAAILGSLSFQRFPQGLFIDGVRELHHPLFKHLNQLDQHHARAQCFINHITAHFFLDNPEEVGLDNGTRINRSRANYQRALRGWLFDPNGREAAVLKGWVESRFGLLPRYHRSVIDNANTDAYRWYEQERALGLYNTNALEAQLDLLYSYAQYELQKRCANRPHLTLYRGLNRLEKFESLAISEHNQPIVLFNNLTSFSSQRERAEEFGDKIVVADIPLAKIFYFSGLLPGLFEGEDEYVVIGGVYEISVQSY